jgi:biopolymer transport protein ExbD
MNLRSSNKIKTEAGMASMTDLVFLLLVFFIIMSTLSEPQTPLDLPQAEQGAPKDNKPKPTTSVGITANNTYFIDNNLSQELSYEEARDQLISLMSESEEKKIKIAGDKEASYEAVFKLISLAQVQGWKPLLAYDKNSAR